jgi:protease-4
MQDKQSGKGVGCLFGCLFVVVGVVLLASLATNGILAMGLYLKGGRTGLMDDQPQDQYPQLTTSWSYGEGDVTVARIPVYGVITREMDDGFFLADVDMVEGIIRQIRAAQADEEVQAIILEIDSPGGAITPTDEIYKALVDFRESSSERRILAFCRGLAASGGYYVAAGADWIVAEPTSIIGSISVIMQTLNWKVLSDKVGVTDVTITSGEHKDLLNPFKAVSEEDRAIVQELVNGMYTHFVEVVCRGRGMAEEALKPYADGRVFLPEVAQEAGLIDEVGYWEDAVAAMERLLDVDGVKVIRYEQPADFWSVFSSVKFDWSPQGLLNRSYPRFWYLWNP